MVDDGSQRLRLQSNLERRGSFDVLLVVRMYVCNSVPFLPRCFTWSGCSLRLFLRSFVSLLLSLDALQIRSLAHFRVSTPQAAPQTPLLPPFHYVE
jgi:hypothetical protein